MNIHALFTTFFTSFGYLLASFASWGTPEFFFVNLKIFSSFRDFAENWNEIWNLQIILKLKRKIGLKKFEFFKVNWKKLAIEKIFFLNSGEILRNPVKLKKCIINIFSMKYLKWQNNFQNFRNFLIFWKNPNLKIFKIFFWIFWISLIFYRLQKLKLKNYFWKKKRNLQNSETFFRKFHFSKIFLRSKKNFNWKKTVSQYFLRSKTQISQNFQTLVASKTQWI